MTVCTVPGCDRPLRARGWCTTHYARWQRTGSHLTIRPRYPERPLDQRISERSTVRDGCRIWNGSRSAAGYGQLRLNGAVTLIHRAVYEQAHGPIQQGIDIHHVCGNRACSTLAHLQAMSHTDHAALHLRGREAA